MPTEHRSEARGEGASGHRTLARRELLLRSAPALTLLGGAGVATTGCGERLVRDPRGDRALLANALETQYQARHAYLRAAPLLRPRERELAASVRVQELQHIELLRDLVERLGGTAPRPLLPEEYDAQLPALRARADALRLLRDVEELELRTHLLTLARVTDPALRRPALELAAADAAHAMLLAALVGEQAPERAFATGRPRG